jgi:hypothetical protein
MTLAARRLLDQLTRIAGILGAERNVGVKRQAVPAGPN